MRLSTLAFKTLLAFAVIFQFSVQITLSQSLGGSTSELEVYKPETDNQTAEKAFSKFIGIHVAPTKIVTGELPVTLSARVSNSWVLEVGAGPTFRDRVAEKIFDGKTLQLLRFENKNADYKLGYGIYAGARYLIDKEMLQGFYVNPELAYLHRNVLYPNNRNERSNYNGYINEVNARILLGYDRALCSYSEHFFYGGFMGFGMRRYESSYYVVNNSVDPGTRHSVETIPTFHLGYRVGYKF